MAEDPASTFDKLFSHIELPKTNFVSDQDNRSCHLSDFYAKVNIQYERFLATRMAICEFLSSTAKIYSSSTKTFLISKGPMLYHDSSLAPRQCVPVIFTLSVSGASLVDAPRGGHAPTIYDRSVFKD